MKKSFTFLYALFCIGLANATIHYTLVNQSVQNTTDSLLIDVNGDNIKDIRLDRFLNSYSEDNTTFRAINGSKIRVNGSSQLDSVLYGQAINSSLTWDTVIGTICVSNYGYGYCGKTIYVALQINVNGNTYYGWANLISTYEGIGSSSLILHDYAWSDGGPITAGEGGTSTGVEHVAETQIHVYPNPFNDYVNFEVPSAIQGDYNLQIKDLSGRTVAVFNQISSSTLHLPLNLAPGIYMAEMIAENKRWVTKLVKQ